MLLTPVRAILKEELRKEIKNLNNEENNDA